MQTDASTTPSGQAEPEAFCRLRDFTGSYYRILGWIDVASSAIALLVWHWTGHLAITCSFIFWFWLGSCLKQGNPAARKWAIAIPIITGMTLAIGAIFPDLRLRLTPWGIEQTHPAYLLLAGIYIVMLVNSGWMLYGDRGRRAFAEKKRENKPAHTTAGNAPV